MEYFNQEYLRNTQYRNATNLKARIELHGRFSTNPADWFRWVFDHFNLPKTASLLEIGCGSGGLWLRNRERLPSGWKIYLSDYSSGMLSDARRAFRETNQSFNFQQINAMSLPFADQSLDAVIANHMLYHVADRPRALSEIQRVLKPGGKLFAATNGEKHMYELDHLVHEFSPELGRRIDLRFNVRGFNLENGAAQLEPWFNCLEVYPYLDSLQITEAAPLAAYIFSMMDANSILEMQLNFNSLENFIKQKISEKGAILIQKSSGLFVALN